ncbi:hypothetical protein GGR51DRAFT_521547 [Nemania sp. FL0031]|nr:hypothetical protein GGR51DRAFT_521547 [Nemania sp. FL0031]
MNTADPKRPLPQTHDTRKRPRDRRSPQREAEPKSKAKAKAKATPKLKPRSRPRPVLKSQKQKTTSEADGGWFSIRDILDEKIERGRILYLIDWDGPDENGRPYDPTWEPAANVTPLAINAWRDKKNEEASKAANAPSQDLDSTPPESTQETDTVQASNQRQGKGPLEQRHSDSTLARLAGNRDDRDDREEEVRRHRRTDKPPARSHAPLAPREEPREPREPRGQLIASGYSGTQHQALTELELAQAKPVTKAQGAQIVVELPSVSTFDPSEFRVILPSQPSQASSQTTLPERPRTNDIAARDQRVIPDSQEISCTSASEAYSSYHGPADLPGESQFTEGPQASQGPSQDSLRAPSSSGIPSHQLDSPIVGISGFFVNPNISSNLGVSTSRVHIAPTSPSPAPLDQSSPVFQTQLEPDFDTVAATSPVATSHSTTIPASFQQHTSAQTPQGTESQHSHTTDRDSRLSSSQAAQIVQPLSSHPGEVALSATPFRESLPVIRSVDDLSIHRATPQESRPITPTNMDHTSATEPPLSAKERLRLLRESLFNDSSAAGSASPTTVSPAVLDNAPYAAFNSTPQAETRASSSKSSAADVSAPLLSPMLPPPSGDIETPTGPSFESAEAQIEPPLSRELVVVDHSSLESYIPPQIELRTTLDPSALTLSIENDVEGSPSTPTDDDFPSGLPRSANSDDDEMQVDYPQSILPHVPTGPYEYLITLPFQTSSRPQYNDIIRESEALINEYSLSFQVLPHETPRKDLVEKLDIMFSRLFDICDFPPFLDSLPSMSPEQTAKHVIGTNAKFSFVAELLHHLQALKSDKKILILVRPGKLMDLLGYVIQSAGCHYIRSDQEVVSAVDAEHPLTVILSSTSDEESSNVINADVVIAFDHTFRQNLVSPIDQRSPPILLALVNSNSIQHINMRIMENLQPLERKNMLMLAVTKAMQHVEEPEPSESLFSIAEKFARRIQMPEEDEDEFYWEPQSIPSEIFKDLYAASSQIDATQLSGQGLHTDHYPDSRKRSLMDDGGDESIRKRPKMFQPQVITSLNPISDDVRDLFEDSLAQGPDKATMVVSIDKLQLLSERFAELESKLEESKARENVWRQLSDRAQKKADTYASSINNIQLQYMDALKERGIFEADCKTAQEQAMVLSNSLESCRTEITTLKATRTELEKKLASANDALLGSSNPDLAKMAELEKELNVAKAELQRLEKKVVVMQSDTDYSKNLYDRASQRAAELAAENRGYEKKLQGLQRKADENIIEVNKAQSRNEVRELVQQVNEQKAMVREHIVELSRVKEELKSLKNGRRETRQSSVPRSPRLSSLGVMSPRNGARGPSAMGGPSSSRGTSPQPPMAVFDGPPGSGNGVQNAALFNQGPGANRFAHLRDFQRF